MVQKVMGPVSYEVRLTDGRVVLLPWKPAKNLKVSMKMKRNLGSN